MQSSVASSRYDLTALRNGAFQWKITFNPDLTKQAQEQIFSRETKKGFTLVFCLIVFCLHFFKEWHTSKTS